MQGLQRRRCSNDAVGLELSTATATATATAATTSSSAASTASLSIDEAEPAEARIQRLISEHPVIIFSRSSCCMCHVMKKLLGTLGVHPTVIELDDDEIRSLGDGASTPSAFIGGSPVGGLDSLFALHLSGRLIPMLVAVGALYNRPIPS